MSQEAMADELGWHRTYIGGVERGERNLTLKSVERLGEMLGVHPLDLLWEREQIAVTFDATGDPRFTERRTRRAAATGAGRAAPSRRTARPRPTGGP